MPAPSLHPAPANPKSANPPTIQAAVPHDASPNRPAPGIGPLFAAARQHLDQGDVAAAARQFESWVLAENSNRFTLQVMIACQEETVKGAGIRAGADTPLFVLPYSLKGRDCYRVCWGLYSDGDAARGAVSGVPREVTGAAVPLLVRVSRLRSSG